ncbi:MAG: Gfo/Idh/MocA family oxidoreductase [Bacteroidetes bacterium]|nr:Gfo/Idh/MocA family oxidoreductase [Bacteroidota bacterium]MDA1119956.1 Gfo/Idh/MocA family oxidoreductase [Bacteroidota bacterium]
MNQNQRRSFIKKLSGTALLSATVPTLLMGEERQQITLKSNQKQIGPNDNIQMAVIGMGIQGFNDIAAAVKNPGVKMVAACDLYDGRLKRAKELYGNDLFTTRNYKEILERSDVDGVIIATSDHWHDRISIDAMAKGKAVYCEKPMVHHLDEGLAVIEAQAKQQSVFQVGSQGVSSIISQKAKEIYESGALGQLVLVETFNDRQSAQGAWQYSIPLDASEKTIDWKTYLGDAPKVPFDPKRFFRWRNYQDYGTGVAGDLFVHLFSRLHYVLSSNGPSKIYTTGGLRYWKDGRDVPDVMIGCYDYPETPQHPAFNLQVRVNFVDGGGGGGMVKFVGSEGTMTVGGNSVSVTRNKMPNNPGYDGWDSFYTFDEKNRADYEKWYNEKYPPEAVGTSNGSTEFRAPRGYSDHVVHFGNFMDAIRNGTKVVEDAPFGFRAGAAALAANSSYFEKKVINWDPNAMKLI